MYTFPIEHGTFQALTKLVPLRNSVGSKLQTHNMPDVSLQTTTIYMYMSSLTTGLKLTLAYKWHPSSYTIVLQTTNVLLFDLTSLSLSGRNDVSTVGFLPSFFFLATGGGAKGEMERNKNLSSTKSPKKSQACLVLGI